MTTKPNDDYAVQWIDPSTDPLSRAFRRQENARAAERAREDRYWEAIHRRNVARAKAARQRAIETLTRSAAAAERRKWET
jgi:hypothetical protein